MPDSIRHRQGRSAVCSIGIVFFASLVAMLAWPCRAQDAASGQPAAKPAEAAPAQPAQNQPAADQPGEPVAAAAQPEKANGAAKEPPAEEPPAEAAPPGQKPYETDPVNENLKRARTDIVKMLRAGRFEAGQQAQFDQYYNQYAFPRWTQPENYNALADFRKDLRVEAQSGKDGGPPHDRLVQLAMDYLTKLAKGHYHPAVRFNAMLAIGDLYAREAQGFDKPPVPLPAALPVLLEAVNAADQIDVVKLAALIGLSQHAKLGIADAQVVNQQVIPAMLKIAMTKVSPGRNAEGHAWIRGRACDVLGDLRLVGQQGEVATTLAEIAGDSTAHFISRCAAARAIGKLNYQGAGVDTAQLAMQVGKLAADALASEADQEPPDFDALLLEKKGGRGPMDMMGMEMGGMMDAMAMGMPGMGPGAPKTAEDERKELEKKHSLILRRRLMDRVAAAMMGLSGEAESFKGISGAAAASPQQKPYVDLLVKRFDSIKDVCNAGDLPYKDLLEKIKTELAELRTTLEKGPAAQPPGPARPAAAG
jgi:hypothetical protein